MADLRKEVVLVDDDKAVRDSLKFALELEGLNVHVCDSAAAALAYPGLRDAACLVVDYKMQGMDGFALCRKIIAEGACPPIIMITAPLTEALKREASVVGFFSILEKPLLNNVLERDVRAAINA
jgi:two-component system response regulator FixJ